jgi:hypothetical protein
VNFASSINTNHEELMTHVHIPTGLPCTVVTTGTSRSYCNFGPRSNPFCWVPNVELRAEPSPPSPPKTTCDQMYGMDRRVDFRYVRNGPVVMLTAVSPDGDDWALENLPDDCARHGNAYVITEAAFPDIHADILDDDLIIVRGH